MVYQVYWRSFFDANQDGMGDLQGVIEKLGYLTDLGVNALWLNPFFESPDVDNGYDISDYRAISSKAGTMEDFDELLLKMHERKMSLIIDMVINHTSDKHPWFVESRKSKDNPYRDFYIWRSQKNNWRSYFSPSAWTFDEVTGEYYFHSFTAAQPDLNWENPLVREAVFDAIEYWLKKGVDGIRFDAISLLAKIPGMPDVTRPEDISYLGNQPKVHEYLRELNERILSRYDLMTVGEVAFVTPKEGLLYVDETRRELDSLFHFQVLDDMPTWDLLRFKQIQRDWYATLNERGGMAQFLNNHDHTRLVTRYGNDQEFRRESAACFATLLHTLPGIPYIYQGEEIGMTGVRYDSIELYQDVAMKERYKEKITEGISPQEALALLQTLARDNSRTPMQWDESIHAGFSQADPWIAVNPNYRDINVEADLRHPQSIFRYYQRLISLRSSSFWQVAGDFKEGLPDHPILYVYRRSLDSDTHVVLMNFSTEVVLLPDVSTCFPEWRQLGGEEWTVTINNYADQIWDTPIAWPDVLRPYEAYILSKASFSHKKT